MPRGRPTLRDLITRLWRRAQTPPGNRELDANHPFFQSEEFKTALAAALKGAFNSCVQAERARVAAVSAAEPEPLARSRSPESSLIESTARVLH